jgi:hypothetical protein
MRNSVFGILFFAVLLILGVHTVTAQDATAKLAEARHFLTGEHKDTDAAKKLLLDLVQTTDGKQDPVSLCWAYIYLGYIEDHAGNREAAIGWYEKAAKVDGVYPNATALAASGIKQPLLWLRSLDSDTARDEKNTAEARSERASDTLLPQSSIVSMRDVRSSSSGGEIVAMMQAAKPWHGDNSAICVGIRLCSAPRRCSLRPPAQDEFGRRGNSGRTRSSIVSIAVHSER